VSTEDTTATWTAEQVLSLAPDSNSAKSGRDLAIVRKWVTLAITDDAVWGECQGSAKDPYRTAIDLNGPAFSCSCPSRKLPCKHSLGLFLLYVNQRDAFKVLDLPAWADKWLTGRATRKEKAAERSEKKQTEIVDPAAQAKRAAAREAKVAAGVTDLERWLSDLARTGLADAAQLTHAHFETMAARLVDAQAPGLSSFIRELEAQRGSRDGWQDRMLRLMGQLHALLEGYRRIGTLTAPEQADIRALIGWPQDKDSVLAGDGVDDRWHVLGQHVFEDENASGPAIRIMRTWLLGEATRRTALSLGFAAPGQSFETPLPVGAAIDATLSFYPGALPLRALVKTRRDALSNARPSGDASIRAALAGYGRAIGAYPWLRQWPMLLERCAPREHDGRWLICDEAGTALPLHKTFNGLWTLLAISGGGPVRLFGEWDGDALRPLTAWAEGRIVQL
jgi:hypothetical protein